MLWAAGIIKTFVFAPSRGAFTLRAGGCAFSVDKQGRDQRGGVGGIDAFAQEVTAVAIEGFFVGRIFNVHF